MPGKFIVIDGTDGSGKKTQTKILIDRLKDLGKDVVSIDFPQYGTKSAGLAEEYLSGKYGTAEEVGPYIASVFYAVDRYDASFKIRQWLKEGKTVVSDRYVSANMGHQGGKISDETQRKKYIEWLYNLEYEIFKIPKPDINIILHVAADISQRLTKERQTNHRGINLKKDIHEENANHIKQAEQTYLHIASSYPNFILVECTENNDIMPVEKISDLILDKIKQLI